MCKEFALTYFRFQYSCIGGELVTWDLDNCVSVAVQCTVQCIGICECKQQGSFMGGFARIFVMGIMDHHHLSLFLAICPLQWCA